MKYLILIYSNPENWEHPAYARTPGFRELPEAEQAELTRQAEALHEEIVASGELVTGVALGAPGDARTFRVRAGVPATTDGPYAEAKEQLVGYFVVECASRERAAEIASRFPDTRFGAVEVRPIAELVEFGTG
ncbi:YciI family protein [Prauserella flavalba]|uniref:YciI family protein n=1 Tax=Prauserella flavalba TaxID=1477506 RepID=UPI0036E1A52A